MSLPIISKKELRFVEEYCHHKIIVRAALAAKLSDEYHPALEQGRQLLKNPDIQKWIRYVQRRTSRVLKFKPADVVKGWQMARTADVTMYSLDENGTLDTVSGIPREYLRCVRKVKYTVREIPRGKDMEPLIERKAEIELRDPFGPECKLMEHFDGLSEQGKEEIRAVIELPTRSIPEGGGEVRLLADSGDGQEREMQSGHEPE